MKRRHRAQAVARTTFEEYIGFLEAIAPTHWWAKITEHDMEFVSTIERTKREYLQQGMQQGFQHGREEGVIFTLRRAIARLATSRGLELTSESQQRRSEERRVGNECRTGGREGGGDVGEAGSEAGGQ